MELELAQQISDMDVMHLENVLTMLKLKDRDAYELLKELVEEVS